MIILRISDPAVLGECFPTETLRRAYRYVESGAVGDVELGALTAHRLTAGARVQGTAPRPYTVDVEVLEDHGEVIIESWCSCPVVHQCKHGAALTMHLGQTFVPRATQPAPPPGWRHQLDGLLAGLAPLAPRDEDHPPLALRFTYDDPAARHRYAGMGAPTIRVRPMRQGKRGWAKSGVDWPELPAAINRRTHDPDQLEALAALLRSLGSQYWYHGVERSLFDFGSQVVRQLREALATGIVLYGDDPIVEVRLLEEPAVAAVDVVNGEHEVGVQLGMMLDGVLRPTSELMLLGGPAHSVARLHDGVLSIAALAAPLPGSVVQTFGRSSSLSVPRAELDELPDYLRRLRRLVAVGSSDGSVAIPEPVLPRLRVTVTWRTAAAAEVAWSWVYGVGPGQRSCPTSSRDQLGGLRDRGAERELLALLTDLDPTDRRVDGADTVSLALLELPAWREIDALDVVEVDAPTFRAAVEAPTISFDLIAPEPSANPDWLDLEVAITIDGERVPLADVLAALTLGHEFLVLPSGLYVPADDPAFARLADAVRAAAELHDRRRDDDRVRVGRHDLGTIAELADLGGFADGAAEWVTRAQALRDLVDLPRPEPVGVTTELRSSQRDGFHWLAFLWQHGLGGILADDMGLGKTLQVLALVAHTRAERHTTPFLVVAPTSVVSAWADEAARHTPGLRVRTVIGTGARRDSSIAAYAEDADIVVTSYTLLRLEAAEYADVEWGAVVLDEAQQVKNHKSQAHAAIRRIRAPFKLAVSGTPFENRLLELWSLLAIVTPGLYPTQRGFNEHVVRPVEKLGDDDALRRFSRRIKPFVLRRTKELVASDLPAKQEQTLTVELTPRHRKLYDSHLAKERQRILGLLDDFDENRVAILAALTRLRQLALDPGLVDAAHNGVGSAKLDLLLAHLTEITAEGHRALVFSTFTGFLGRARSRLEAAGIEYTYLDGSTTRRAAVIKAFRTGDAPVFLISLKAGGVGLTLTEADYVYVLDPWWNPAAEAQAVDRAHRIGQERTVLVYRLVATDTIEDKVMALKERKAALFSKVIDGEGATSQTIDADDIRALFD